MKEPYLIECPSCEATMGAMVQGVVTEPATEDDPGPFRVTLAECPKCGLGLVGLENAIDGEWTSPSRVWPSPLKHFSWKIPSAIRSCLEEAHKCLKTNTYTASVAMAGRALEGVVRHFTTPTTGLKNGIAQLHDKKLIDQRLYEWAEALHLDRNDAAHFSGQTFNKQDAEDILKFTTNICEYLFVLSKEFEQFRQRKLKRPKARSVKNA